ncbi:hypothetical protein [Paenibacillus sp. 2TAB19]|uniref:hypothetical protein n=1 Tax=Paenibacillus sp. 2TAB19 TaxID=3233003 RepID=UPI003F97CDC1
MVASRKKSFYKKWWFWFVVIVIVIIGSFGNNSNEAADLVKGNLNETSAAEAQIPIKAAVVNSSGTEAALPEFEIIKDELNDAGISHLTLVTASKDKKELEKLVQHASELAFDKGEEVQSVFVYILEKDNTSSAYLATGKKAFTNKGEAQTNVKIGEVEFKSNLE